MRAIIIAVGTELLGTDRLDTNSLRLTETLLRHGVELRRKVVVGDSESEIAAQIRLAAAECEVLLVTGGLGPTADDVTREATAAAFGRGLIFDESILKVIEERFTRMHRKMAAVNRRQAFVIGGATVIPNPRGTAPALRLELEACTVFLFPGVPHELFGLIKSDLEPWLRERAGEVALESVTLRVACVPEADVEEQIAPAYAEFGRETITVLASPGDVRVRLSASGRDEERAARLKSMTDRVAGLLGEALYSRREEDDLETVVGALLRGFGATVSTAESCTGGWIAQRLTRIAGSSDYFLGGAVTYSNRLKEELLDVSCELLEEHGAVSEPVARAMAEGVCRLTGSDFGISVTGIAGPGGGSEAKPVGTVHFALAHRESAVSWATVHRQVTVPGDRERVRFFSSQVALELLRRHLRRAAA
ncbi:MAG: competence/damage-inducible protein A [Acidobacteriota bacterium]